MTVLVDGGRANGDTEPPGQDRHVRAHCVTGDPAQRPERVADVGRFCVGGVRRIGVHPAWCSPLIVSLTETLFGYPVIAHRSEVDILVAPTPRSGEHGKRHGDAHTQDGPFNIHERCDTPVVTAVAPSPTSYLP